MKELFVTFWAGVLTFLSPCVLPLIPAYLSMISGVSAAQLLKEGENRVHLKVFYSSVFFFFGFSLVFSLMGAAASFLGSFLLSHREMIQKIMGIALIILGAHTAGFLNINFLNYEKRASLKSENKSFFSSFLMGAAFAFSWSPCIGPVLAGILMMASSASFYKGILMLFVYALGLGLPFIAAGFFGASFFKFISSKKKALFYTEKVAGIALIILGILLFLNKFSIE